MKITIASVAVFHVGVDLQTVNDLMRLAEGHYDGACKAAGRQGGFLFGWRNLIEWHEKEARENPGPGAIHCRPTGTFRDLDTTLKICEMAQYMFRGEPDALMRIHAYEIDIIAALARANELHSKWREEM